MEKAEKPRAGGSLIRGVVVKINAAQISDWQSFHAVFKRELGFPAFYGENMDAWIDCMTYLDDPNSGMTSFNLRPDELAILEISNTRSFKEKCPDQYEALIDCSAFVNSGDPKSGGSPILALTLIE
ncbi:barstar family protein [Rhizobium sp. 2YAF20]|uniref:barstar family protein n=1 Tax=Rhizobium sp. 2YAF20 TaxID=3233027 RepID=UPI003F963A63